MRTFNQRFSAGVVAGALLLGVSGCSMPFQSKGVPETAAQVRGVPITSKTIASLYDVFKNTQQGQADTDPNQNNGLVVSPKQIRATALTYQIRLTFLEELAKERGIDLTKVDDTDFGELAQDIAQSPSLQSGGFRAEDLQIAQRAATIAQEIAKSLLPEVLVNDQEIQDAYDARKDVVDATYRASTNIAFMDDEASAKELRDRLDKGEKFADVVRDLGGEKVLRVGDVEVTPISPAPAYVKEAVKPLKEGKTSDPIRQEVQDGSVYIVLHVYKRKDLPKLDIKDAKPELSEIVISSKRNAFFQQWFDKKFREADIDVDGYYGKWDRSFLAVT
ncbi:MAG: peptidyl-prolyl cis-trans isomerase [Sporichthyaceae bacterium]